MKIRGTIPIYGVGVNDADYKVETIDADGKRKTCPYYKRWVHMLERAYSEKYHARKPTYKDITVCKEWHIFSNFKRWMERQQWVGKQLDKDIIVPGNMVYSPDRCCFVTNKVNKVVCISKKDYTRKYAENKIMSIREAIDAITDERVIRGLNLRIKELSCNF